jgi:hypothetical protein
MRFCPGSVKYFPFLLTSIFGFRKEWESDLGLLNSFTWLPGWRRPRMGLRMGLEVRGSAYLWPQEKVLHSVGSAPLIVLKEEVPGASSGPK